jgi:hypothetical protein
MTDDTGRLYPDLTAAGGLTSALQSTLIAVGSPLTVSALDPAVNFVVYARVESGPRFSQIYIAVKERLFLFDFWSRGVMLAQGQTPDLGDTARAISRWVGSGCTTAELASSFAFVAAEPAAASFERGEEVEHRWRDYLANLDIPGDPFPELDAFVQAASRRRELRQLFPFTSLNSFCFSRCTGYPFTQDTPHVTPLPNGQYEVVGPDGQALGRGDAEEAARLVVENLPANCGPAIPGTADDLPPGTSSQMDHCAD